MHGLEEDPGYGLEEFYGLDKIFLWLLGYAVKC